MVTLTDSTITIAVETNGLTAYLYEQIVNETIYILQDVSPDMRGDRNYYHLLELLRAMMPDEEQEKKMCE